MEHVPLPGDYGCVQMPWVLHHRVLGVKFPLPNLFGMLIQLLTWSKFSHAFVYAGHGEIIEAQWQGTTVSPLSKYNGCLVCWSPDDMDYPMRRRIIREAWSFLGVRYGFPDIAWQFLSCLGIRWGWLMRKVVREDREICSQEVATCGVRAGQEAWECGKGYPAMVTPKDLAARCQRREVLSV